MERLTRLLLSAMLVLTLLAVVAVAIGLNGDNSVQAQSQEKQMAVISVTTGSATDPGGGTSASSDQIPVTVTLTGVRFDEEGSAVVPEYNLIFPIATQSGSIVNDRLDTNSITNASGQQKGSVTITIAGQLTLAPTSLQSACPQGNITKTMHFRYGGALGGVGTQLPQLVADEGAIFADDVPWIVGPVGTTTFTVALATGSLVGSV